MSKPIFVEFDTISGVVYININHISFIKEGIREGTTIVDNIALVEEGYNTVKYKINQAIAKNT